LQTDAIFSVVDFNGLTADTGQRQTPSPFKNPAQGGKPASQDFSARYNILTMTITRMITIKRPIMMNSFVLGQYAEIPRIKIRSPSLHQ
jgi:hypothetical protein